MIKMIKRLPPAQTVSAIVFLLIQTACALVLPTLTAGIVDIGIVGGNIPYIWQTGMLMMGISVLSLAGALLNTWISARISYQLGHDLRDELYGKVLGFSKREFDKFGTSSLVTRSVNDVTQVQAVVEMGLKFLILCPLYMIGGIFFTWRLNPAFALMFVAAVPLLLVAAIAIYKAANPLYGRMQQLIDQLNLFLREGLTGVKVTRAFNRQEESRKYDQTNREYTANAIKAGTVMGLFIPLVTLMMGIATLAVVWQGAGAAAAGAAEVGAIMAAITYAAQILLGFSILTNVILMLPRGQVSAKRINEVLETRASLTDGCESGIGSHKSLVFRNVAFGYPEAGKMTLEDISLTVGEGQTLAIIGSTGDGKSTMVSLATRLYDVERGSVLLNGTDVRNLRQDMICQRISLAPQHSTLFFGTVRSNMQMGKPDASDAEIWAALDMAQASEFVHLLEGGLDAAIDKNGGNFSGGQKQRLCIARALLKDADIYMFDDSFSALDFKTDKAVRTAMRKKTCNAITVIVAQRIATVMEADLIAVLENGRLTGLDTHENLSRTNRVYQEIIASQFQKEVAA